MEGKRFAATVAIVGYGEKGDIFGLEFLAERKSRHGRRR
jgi:hypothetical protein